MKHDDSDFMDMVYVIVLFVVLVAGAFWVQNKYSNSTQHFDADIR